jgi:hypothetical protein
VTVQNVILAINQSVNLVVQKTVQSAILAINPSVILTARKTVQNVNLNGKISLLATAQNGRTNPLATNPSGKVARELANQKTQKVSQMRASRLPNDPFIAHTLMKKKRLPRILDSTNIWQTAASRHAEKHQK